MELLILSLIALFCGGIFIYYHQSRSNTAVRSEEDSPKTVVGKKETDDSINRKKLKEVKKESQHRSKTVKEESRLRLGGLRGHTQEVASFCVSPDGRTAATSSKDQTIKIWDINSLKVEGNAK